MARNMQPIAKRCKALNLSPAEAPPRLIESKEVLTDG